MIKIILTVTNDIVTDNRVHKIASTLSHNGYQVTIVGRRFSNSSSLFNKVYNTRRFKLWFKKSFLFYLNYNLRCAAYLFSVPVDIIVANDLDTLPACWLAAKLRRKVLVFDSHELYTEVPELVNRPFARKVWQTAERFLVPGINYGYTVSEPIQKILSEKYNKSFELVRNVGYFSPEPQINTDTKETIILYQGAVNVGRGIELMIHAMKHVKNAKLWIIGGGDVLSELKKLVLELELESQVVFFGRVRKEELSGYTSMANIGLSLEEDLGLNYRYALPNKIFDYIQSRLPVIVSDLPEMAKLVETYQIGEVLRNRTPEGLAYLINSMVCDQAYLTTIGRQLELASRELCWEREEEKIIQLYRQAYEQVGKHSALSRR